MWGPTATRRAPPASSALTVTGKYPTTTTITQGGVAGNYTLTATVAGYVNETGLAAPTGTVSFLDTSNGNAVLGTVELGTGASALGWLNSQTPATGGDPSSVAVGRLQRGRHSGFGGGEHGLNLPPTGTR